MSIHPLALALGVVGVFCLVFLLAASSHQKQQLQVMARRMLRKKRKSFSEETAASGGSAPSDLPGFVRSAAESGNARVVKRWVHSTDRNVDARSAENLSALHYAVRGGHNECTRLLLTANADPNAQDERSITPLHLAAVGGHALCVKLLLDHHADPFREDVDHHTPLFIAEQSGNIGCARLLQRAMAKAAVHDDAAVTLRAGTSTARIDNAV
ncbi:Ankyrin repeat [Phytophthora boehmeriae]|uniref:Ankyrin repeat n=1 Tax=Phytophthora boehmeriae TaxID=109152 RepID=A0A8T1WFA4_9STRA|nr:Ankyrin repeat [Phytophthora boehmeriae]